MKTLNNLGGWQSKSLRELVTINYGKSPTNILSSNGNYPVVGTGGTERLGNAYLYEGESIILGRKGTIDRIHFVSGRFWTIDTAYFLNNFIESIPKWLFYFLQTIDLRQMNEATGVPSLSRDILYKINVPIPSKSEQAKIAEILSTVDRAIEQTEALLAKYKAIKKGMMQDFFTRGIILDTGKLRPRYKDEPNLYKPTELGQIPKEWEVKPLIELCKKPIRDFGSFSSTNLITFLDNGIPFIKSEMIEEGNIKWDGVMYISKNVHRLLNKSHVYKGNILFSKIGSALGKAVFYDGSKGECNSNAAVAKIEIDCQKASTLYISYYLNHNIAQKQLKNMILSLLPRINLGDLNYLLVPVPTLIEQDKIKEKFLTIDSKIKIEEQELKNNQKLKTALMQDLLTGKKRVTPLLKLDSENVQGVLFESE
ncbi:MAG: restriction endonuclease subunit S [Planctomycetota bacterium]